MAGTYRIKTEIDTTQALNALGGLRTALLGIGGAIAGAFSLNVLTNVAGRFEDLRVTLGTLYKDTQVGAEVFEDIKKLAGETVFSVENLTETVIKLRAAGIDPTLATLRLFADVSSVAADSVGALQAITDLYARTTAGGLGLEDLNRLADRGIPVFTILQERLGLGRLELSKFGQTAEGAQLILQALEQGLQDAFGGASINRLGTVNQSLSQLQDAIDNALDTVGVSGFNKEFSAAIQTLTEFIQANRGVAVALGEGLGKAIKFVADNMKILTAAAAGFLTVLTVSAVLRIAQAFAVFNAVLGKNALIKLLLGIGAALFTFDQLDQMTQNVSEEFGKFNDDLDKTNNGFKQLKEGSISTVTDLKSKVAALNEETAKQARELAKIGEAYERNLGYVIDALERENLMIDRSIARQRIIDETGKIERSTKEALIALDERYFGLDKKAREEQFANYQKQREAIQETGRIAIENATKIIEATEANRAIITDLSRAAEIYGNTAERIFREQIELGMETNANYRQQIELTERMNTLLAMRSALMANIANIASTEKAAATELLNEIMLTTKNLGLSYEDMQKKIITQIQLAQEQGRISKETADELLRGVSAQMEAIGRAGEAMTKHTQQMAEQRRSWSFGWNKAMRDYVDDATNAARQAQNVFQKATKGMEDLIVNFAKTGKFEFKSFINSILEELLRSQIQQMIAGIFNTGRMGGGGSRSVLGSILGFAGGFANGGFIPPGKYGMVGERGPELINGPASVTPLGSTMVTYNINAVDAMSFKQMVASDPGFIYAVTEQGRKTLPSSRR